MPDRERAAERIRAALPLHQVDVGTREHLADCPTCDAFDALESLLTELRNAVEAVEALVDVSAYLHPNPESPRADVWEEWKQAALDKAAVVLADALYRLPVADEHTHDWRVDYPFPIVDTLPQQATYRCDCGATKQDEYPRPAADEPRCDYCGLLGWTVEKYGRPTHKETCPHRTDPWHQGSPAADETPDDVARLAAALEELLDVAESIRGGDPKLDPERWYSARDHARVVLEDVSRDPGAASARPPQ